MVSIHRIPIVLYLTIRVLCFAFRFKRDNATLSKYLYRVQKLAHNNYFFRLHLETSVDDKYNGVKNEMLSKSMKKLVIIQSQGALENLNPHKVHVSVIGKITEI